MTFQLLDDGHGYPPAPPTAHGRDVLSEPPADRAAQYRANTAAPSDAAPGEATNAAPASEASESGGIKLTAAQQVFITLGIIAVVVVAAIVFTRGDDTPEAAPAPAAAPAALPAEKAASESSTDEIPAELEGLNPTCSPGMFVPPVAHTASTARQSQCAVVMDNGIDTFTYMKVDTTPEIVEKLRNKDFITGEEIELNVKPGPGHELVAVEVGGVASVFDLIDDDTVAQIMLTSGPDSAAAVLKTLKIA